MKNLATTKGRFKQTFLVSLLALILISAQGVYAIDFSNIDPDTLTQEELNDLINNTSQEELDRLKKEAEEKAKQEQLEKADLERIAKEKGIDLNGDTPPTDAELKEIRDALKEEAEAADQETKDRIEKERKEAEAAQLELEKKLAEEKRIADEAAKLALQKKLEEEARLAAEAEEKRLELEKQRLEVERQVKEAQEKVRLAQLEIENAKTEEAKAAAIKVAQEEQAKAEAAAAEALKLKESEDNFQQDLLQREKNRLAILEEQRKIKEQEELEKAQARAQAILDKAKKDKQPVTDADKPQDNNNDSEENPSDNGTDNNFEEVADQEEQEKVDDQVDFEKKKKQEEQDKKIFACMSTPAAVTCKAQGYVYQCDLKLCATQEEVRETAKGYFACDFKTGDEKKECTDKIEDKIARRTASGGAACDADNSPEAASCKEKGKVWNCNYNLCLGDEMVDYLKDEVKVCQKEEDSQKNEECFDAVNDKAITYEASGKNCDNTNNPDAITCQAAGKVWNCNANYCLSPEQNDLFAAEVLSCNKQPNTQLETQCNANLQKKTLDIVFFTCDIENNEEAKSCTKKWNCEVKMCLSIDDNNRLANSIVECNAKPTEEEKDICLGELQRMADESNNSDEYSAKLNSDAKKFKKGAKMMAGAGGLAAIAGALTTFTTKDKKCMGGMANMAAGAMAILNEVNGAKEAEAVMKELKTRYDELERKKGEEGVSFELQVEAFEFYLDAARAAQKLAKSRKKGYQMNLMMFGIAAVLSGIDIMIAMIPTTFVPPQPPIQDKLRCGIANVATAGLGLGLSAKMLSAAKKAIKDYAELERKIVELLALFKKHFSNKGGLAIQEGQLRDYASIKADNGYRNQLEKKKKLLKGEEIKDARDDIADATSDAACLNSKGKVDRDCACRKTKSCLKSEVKDVISSSVNAQTFAKKFELGSIYEQTNRVTTGEITADKLDSNFLNKNARRLSRLAKKIISKKLDKRVRDNGGKSIFVTKEDLENYVRKNGTKENYEKYAHQNINLNNFVPKGTELDKAIGEGKVKIPTSNTFKGLGSNPEDYTSLRSPTSKKSMLKPIDFSDDEDDDLTPLGNSIFSSEEKLAKDLAEQEEEEKLLKTAEENKERGLVTDSSLSLFKVISNRYNVLRLKKRLGVR